MELLGTCIRKPVNIHLAGPNMSSTSVEHRPEAHKQNIIWVLSCTENRLNYKTRCAKSEHHLLASVYWETRFTHYISLFYFTSCFYVFRGTIFFDVFTLDLSWGTIFQLILSSFMVDEILHKEISPKAMSFGWYWCYFQSYKSFVFFQIAAKLIREKTALDSYHIERRIHKRIDEIAKT